MFLVVTVLACQLVFVDTVKVNYLGPNDISRHLDPVPMVAAMVVVGEESGVKLVLPWLSRCSCQKMGTVFQIKFLKF